MSYTFKKVALLVIDMQEAFRPCGHKILPKVNDLIRFCESKSIQMIFTQQGHRYPSIDGGMLIDQFGLENLFVYGSKRWEFMEGLDFTPGNVIIVEKRRYDAFYGTILDNLLRQLKVVLFIIV